MPRDALDPNIDYHCLLMPPGVRGAFEIPNIANRGLQQSCAPFQPTLQPGFILRSGVGTYDYTVWTTVNHHLPCIQACGGTAFGSGFGTAEDRLLPEGCPVLVQLSHAGAGIGVIVSAGVGIYGGVDDKYQAPVWLLDPESSAAEYTEQSYREPRVNKDYLRCLPATSGRPADLMPGNLAWHNELGVGMGVLNLMTFMRASHQAKIEAFIPDDLLRMVSGSFQHFSAGGEHRIYNDFGHITNEFGFTPHQCEAFGRFRYDEALFEATACDREHGKYSDLKPTDDKATAFRRLQLFLGDLGGLVRLFVQAPPKDAKVNTADSDKLDQGLLDFGIDGCGRVMLRSAGDIVLERGDRIPVPKKRFEYDDPAGDKLSEAKDGEAKKPFQWTFPDDPLSHALEGRDALAWASRMLDERFRQLSEQAGKKDWSLPEAADQPCPEDAYDLVSGDKEDFSKNDKRSARLVLRKDGSITLQEHDGAELTLAGGKIIITAPKGVELRSGKSIVALAKEDLVLKAKDSVDISATDKDVRLKAEGNLQMYAGKGALVEADGKGYHGLTPDLKGEQVPGGGIALLARNGRVFSYGDIVHNAGKTALMLETLEESQGGLIISAKTVVSVADVQVHLGGQSSGFISAGSCSLIFGGSALICGDSAMIFNGEQVPIMWADVSNVYQQIAPNLSGIWDAFKTSKDWLQPYEPSARKDMYFTFRDDPDYGLTDPKERCFESLWAYVARTAGEGPKDPWEEKPRHETWPWPGKKHTESADFYFQLDKETNIADPKTGEMKPRADRTERGGGLSPKPFSAFVG